KVAREQAQILRRIGWVVAAVASAAALLLPVVVTNSAAVILTLIMTFTVLGLGLGIISGLAGQLSLGQFGIAATGAAASYLLLHGTGNVALAIPGAIIVGAVVATVLGVPAVRIRGLMFAVVTM